MSSYAKFTGLGGGSGTVTSITFEDLTGLFTIAAGPVTTSGTIGLTGLNTKSANTVFAGPSTGGASAPAFRSLVAADISSLFGNLTDAGTDGITVTGGTGVVLGAGTSIAQHVADTTHNGYLSSTDWNSFNSKQAALTIGNLTDVGTDGIVVTGGTGSVIGSGTSIAQHVADTTHNGYLSSTDWNTFAGKQAAFSGLTTDGVIYATSSSAVASTGAGTTAYPLVSNGGVGSAPTFQQLTLAGLASSVYNTTPTASTLAEWDSNLNLFANNLVPNFATNLTASGTTTLTNSSAQIQRFTGTSTQTVVLPVVTTLTNGFTFIIDNASTGNVTVQTSGGNTLKAVGSSNSVTCTVIDTTAGTGTASWEYRTSSLSAGGLTVTNGGTGRTSVATAPTASTYAGWDANKNFSANAFIPGFTTVATASGTTALTIASTQIQVFTGSSPQIVTMPTTSIVAGARYSIYNLSSGVVTVQASGGGNIQAMDANTYLTLTANAATPTSAAGWYWIYGPLDSNPQEVAQGGTGLSSTTAYAPICGGTTTTGALQSASTGQSNSGWVLTSNGSSALPTFQAPSAGAFTAPTIQSFTSTGTTAGYFFTVSSANATNGATYTNNGHTYTVLATISAGTQLFCTGTSAPTASGTLTKATGTGDATITFSAQQPIATYVTPGAAPLYVDFKLAGGGGGGAGGSTLGSDGKPGCFVSATAILAIAGQGFAPTVTQGAGGLGGTYTINSPAIDLGSDNGGPGTGGNGQAEVQGGNGGSNSLGGGGGGGPGTASGSNGTQGAATTGVGGGGYGATSGTGGGPGGGAAAVARFRLVSPGANTTYYYCVGASGAGGTGSLTGGAGSGGRLVADEHYQ